MCGISNEIIDKHKKWGTPLGLNSTDPGATWTPAFRDHQDHPHFDHLLGSWLGTLSPSFCRRLSSHNRGCTSGDALPRTNTSFHIPAEEPWQAQPALTEGCYGPTTAICVWCHATGGRPKTPITAAPAGFSHSISDMLNILIFQKAITEQRA